VSARLPGTRDGCRDHRLEAFVVAVLACVDAAVHLDDRSEIAGAHLAADRCPWLGHGPIMAANSDRGNM
jgi:hypothetical protein